MKATDKEILDWQRAKGHRIFRSGDRMRVRVAGRKSSLVVTFKRQVVPEHGAAYLEVIDSRTGAVRCISPEAFVGGAK
jgi:hypothetical protein